MSGNSIKEKEEGQTYTAPVLTGQEAGADDFEVFKKNSDGVDYRTNGWIRTFALMFKVQFSLGVLSIPSLFFLTGAVPSVIMIVGWGLWNWWAALIQGEFRNRHPAIHSQQDMAFVVGGKYYREFVTFIYLLGYILVTGSGIVASSVAFNALTSHGACSAVFGFVSMILVTLLGSFPRFSQISILSWGGCISIFISVFIVMVGVTQRDRPFAAPQTGDFDLGVYAFAPSDVISFVGVVTASSVIFISSSGHNSFAPMIAEMRNPKDYKKSVAATALLLNSSYLVFGIVIYYYCGKWVASPSLGSAGNTIKIVCYGIGLPGILMSATINLHIAAKAIFVRLTRNTVHLQGKTKIHYLAWYGSAISVGLLGWVVAESIPFFNNLIGLVGSICFTPSAVIFPCTFWLYDHMAHAKGNLKQKLLFALHVTFIVIGLFQTVAGAYANTKSIVDAYAANIVGSAFSCADNSNSS